LELFFFFVGVGSAGDKTQGLMYARLYHWATLSP
jgi:hypothetical protein